MERLIGVGPLKDLSFSFEGRPFSVVLDQKGDPWWYATEICALLDINNPRQAVSRLDADERRTVISNDGGPERNIVNESGLYALVLGSRKPEAKAFKRWITHEVLPSIRKTGVYELPPAGPVQVLLSMSRTDALRMALHLSEELDALKVHATQHQATIAVLEPKAQALDRLSEATGNHCVTDAAKVLRMRPSDLFDWLSKRNWIYRRPNGGAWVAYQDRIDGGWLINKVSTICQPGRPDRVVDRLLVTPKGLAHLSQLMSKAAS